MRQPSRMSLGISNGVSLQPRALRAPVISSAPSGEPCADDLPALVADTEAAWHDYLSRLDEAELSRSLEWEAADGRRYRWDVEGILTQVFGHAWYHRGQIALYLDMLGIKNDFSNQHSKLPQLL